MIYHAIVIEAFRPFRDLKTHLPSTSSEPAPPPTSIARQIIEASLAQLRRLFYIQRYRYGGPPVPGLIANPIHILASALLEDLREAQRGAQSPAQQTNFQQEPTPSSSAHSSPITTRSDTTPGRDREMGDTESCLCLVVSTLYDFGQSYPIVHVLLHSLLATFTSNPNNINITLPKEVDDIRHELQDKLFRQASIAEIQERYPVEGEILSTDPTKTAVEELTRAAREISLGGKGPTDEEGQSANKSAVEEGAEQLREKEGNEGREHKRRRSNAFGHGSD
jgi:hypothetical protein